MDNTQLEVAAVAGVTLEVTNELRSLDDLELALIGGGQGDVAFG